MLPVKVTKPELLNVSKPKRSGVALLLWLPRLPFSAARMPLPLGLYSAYVRATTCSISGGISPFGPTQWSKSRKV